jgi:NAD-dependent deacetylase
MSGAEVLDTAHTEGDPEIERLIALAHTRRRIVAFTGAGISTESGIPDYRGPDGVWARQAPPTIGDFRSNPATRRDYWVRRRSTYPALLATRPNAGHAALVALERYGLLTAVVTQNIDGLHQQAGNDPTHVIELHGSAHEIRCLDCGRGWPAAAIDVRLRKGEDEPACTVCGGLLRTATVLFGESLPAGALRRAAMAAHTCDLMLVVGTSLIVNPAARLPLLAKESGAALAIINDTPTPLDPRADVVVRARAGPTLAALATALIASSGADGTAPSP